MSKSKRGQISQGAALSKRDEVAVVLSDLHVPYLDKAAWRVTCEFLRFRQPTHLFLLGDIVDFYSLSAYDKNPERILDLQDDLDQLSQVLETIREILPTAKVVFSEGNHEHRLLRYLQKHPELYRLRALQMPKLLDLERHDITHLPYHAIQRWHGLILEHGSLVRSKSAYTASGMLDKRGTSGISGHVHRLGSSYRTQHDQTIAWWENGCLCDLNPEYVIGKPDWQHGFTVVHAVGGKERFWVEQVPIINGKIYYHGQMFYSKKKANDSRV